MKSTMKKAVATLLSLTMILGWVAFAQDVKVDAGSYATAQFVRISGTDRYDTANRIAADGWTSADTVVLASGTSYPDALAGAPLAYALDAPVLLVSGTAVPDSVMQQIYSLGATDIVILGGTAAVSSSIESDLRGKNFTVERIWGQTRYETSVEVARRLTDLAGAASEAFVVSGENYPDALAVSPVASLKGAPIIYSNKKGTIDSGSAALLSANGVDTAYVIGGTAAISDSVRTNLSQSGVSSVTRISGNSRYETALKVADHFVNVFTTKAIAFATGENYPDALAGGVFAAKKGMPVLLTNGKLNADDSSSVFLTASAYNESLSFTENLVDFINRFQPEEVFVFGGEKAVPNVTIDSYFDGETWKESTTTTTTTTTTAPTTAPTAEGNTSEDRTFNLRRTVYMMRDEYHNIDDFTDLKARDSYIAANGERVFFEISGVEVTDNIRIGNNDSCEDHRYLTESQLQEVCDYISVHGGDMLRNDALQYADERFFPDSEALIGGMYFSRDEKVDSSGVLELTDLKTNTLYVIQVTGHMDEYGGVSSDYVGLEFLYSPYVIYLSDEDYDKYVSADGYWDGNFAIPIGYAEDADGNIFFGHAHEA